MRELIHRLRVRLACMLLRDLITVDIVQETTTISYEDICATRAPETFIVIAQERLATQLARRLMKTEYFIWHRADNRAKNEVVLRATIGVIPASQAVAYLTRRELTGRRLSEQKEAGPNV